MKRKIKDFKDFMECIKAGKKVTKDDGKLLYYFENGYICCKYTDGFGWYNTAVDTEELSRLEVEEHKEEKPLKIETGRFYCTRDGRRAYCFYQEKGVYNHFVIDGEIGSGIYADDGLAFSDEESPEDIVGIWEAEI